MKRLKNTLTTGLGLILLGSTLLFVWLDKATFTEASGFITMSLALMLSKDEPFKNNLTQ